jgi:hypothetical protein
MPNQFYLLKMNRTHNDTFLGQRILALPASTVDDIWVPLSIEESIIMQ